MHYVRHECRDNYWWNLIWRFTSESPNCQIKTTAKVSAFMVVVIENFQLHSTRPVNMDACVCGCEYMYRVHVCIIYQSNFV